ncbi:MAG: DNA alkylation repair protein [Kofleriaceae bacterium]
MTLLAKIRRALREVAEPARAAGMQAYMKSTMPYHGVPAPAMTAACKKLFADYPFDDAEQWRTDILDVWRGATFREERYAAMRLSGHKRADAFQTLDALPMYEEMITTGAWWDYVDELASNRVGPLLAKFPGPMKKTMRTWSKSDDMWKARTSIICQLGFKADTDLKLLYDCIEPSIASKEFFLRKAIGWALRQHARVAPTDVKRYVLAHPELSGLSKREALKHL